MTDEEERVEARLLKLNQIAFVFLGYTHVLIAFDAWRRDMHPFDMLVRFLDGWV